MPNANVAPGPKAATIRPGQARDVMIVPNQPHLPKKATKNQHIFFENFLFARQWQQKDPLNRAVVKMPVGGGPADFVKAVEDASKIAGGHKVILFVGHAGAGGGHVLDPQTGTYHDVPASFDSAPEPGPMQSHHGLVTQELMLFEQIAQKVNGKWIPRPQAGVGHPTVSQTKVDSMAPHFEALVKVGTALRQAQVQQFFVLSCSVGGDKSNPDFATMLQGFLGVPVRLPKLFVTTEENDFTGPPAKLIQLWFTRDHDNPDSDRPPNSDRSHPSFSELPSGPYRDVP